jgi:CRP-like cAMP-binding protein
MEFALLEALDDEHRRAVIAEARRRRFGKGEVLFHEGDPGDTFHLLAKGRVAIRVSTPQGDVATLAVLPAGASFGELALLASDHRRTATAIALEPTETMALSRDAFEELRARHPSVAQALLTSLAAQIDRLSARLVEALYVPAEQRVLRRVLDLESVYGDEPIPLSQEELAMMAGTTRPTANRVLQKAVARGLVSMARGSIVVVDRPGLTRLSH